jgi:hypothetical protein
MTLKTSIADGDVRMHSASRKKRRDRSLLPTIRGDRSRDQDNAAAGSRMAALTVCVL